MSALQSLHTGAPSHGSDRGTPGTGSHGRGSGHPTWHWGALRGDTECRPSIPPVTAAPLVRPASHGLSPCWRGIWDSAPPFTAGRRAQGRVGPATRPAGGSWRQVTWAVPRRWAQSPHGCRAQEVHFHFLTARGPGVLSVGRQGSPHPGGVGLWPVPPRPDRPRVGRPGLRCTGGREGTQRWSQAEPWAVSALPPGHVVETLSLDLCPQRDLRTEGRTVALGLRGWPRQLQVCT